MESNILIVDTNANSLFSSGAAVFKITIPNQVSERIANQVGEKMVGMVNTREEYEKKLADHYYVSILHIAPVTYRLAYLYDCLNREKGIPREETFTFWYRILGKHEWKRWFVVSPYTD